ncbi:Uncharacterized protein dnl_35700 [Desulfonema limicola]|uniref:Uncharacterized protein n=1 Tax=Desulfonema limicola TaxID=45656 RepID=A0A975GHE8_9BACT|nr:Uncharacterized protein dnl_35700 [Desulfonema limicola]
MFIRLFLNSLVLNRKTAQYNHIVLFFDDLSLEFTHTLLWKN